MDEVVGSGSYEVVAWTVEMGSGAELVVSAWYVAWYVEVGSADLDSGTEMVTAASVADSVADAVDGASVTDADSDSVAVVDSVTDADSVTTGVVAASVVDGSGVSVTAQVV